MNIEIISNRIHEIRGHRVMLDYDIAEMFDVETKRLNEQVKRNIDRFPDDFMFQLSEHEWGIMRSQIATSSDENSLRSQFATLNDGVLKSQIAISKSERGKHKKFLPYAFTEHGVTMLSSVIKSERAVKTSIAVVRAFISMKQYIAEKTNVSKAIQEVKDELSDRIDEQDVQIIEIYEVLDKLIEANKEPKPTKRNPIGFETKIKK